MKANLLSRLAVIAIVLLVPAAPVAAAVDWSRAKPVTVVATDYQFTPRKLTFRHGVAYRLHFENRGKEMHEFNAPDFFKSVELGDPTALNADKTEIAVAPGEAKDLTFVPKKAGRYRLRCPDHDWAGMTGAITVE